MTPKKCSVVAEWKLQHILCFSLFQKKKKKRYCTLKKIGWRGLFLVHLDPRTFISITSTGVSILPPHKTRQWQDPTSSRICYPSLQSGTPPWRGQSPLWSPSDPDRWPEAEDWMVLERNTHEVWIAIQDLCGIWVNSWHCWQIPFIRYISYRTLSSVNIIDN